MPHRQPRQTEGGPSIVVVYISMAQHDLVYLFLNGVELLLLCEVQRRGSSWGGIEEYANEPESAHHVA